MLKIYYNGKDITAETSVNSFVLERGLSPYQNNATLVFNDADKVSWATWGVSIGDKISLEYDEESLGEYQIDAISLDRGTYAFELTAASIIRQSTISCVFNNKKLSDVLKTLSGGLSLSPAFFGSFDAEVGFYAIEKRRVFDAIEELGSLFGFCFFEDAGKIRFLTYDYLRKQKPTHWQIDLEDDYVFEFSRPIKSVELSNGKETTSAENALVQNGAKIQRTVAAVVPLETAAKAILAAENLKAKQGARMITKRPEDAFVYPGQTMEITNADKANFDGLWLVRKVRFTAASREQKIFLNKLDD